MNNFLSPNHLTCNIMTDPHLFCVVCRSSTTTRNGRGLCHLEDRVRLTFVDEVDDTGMPSSSPPVAAEGHLSQERSDDIHSSGVAPTATCK
jgi:hypothetical protein